MNPVAGFKVDVYVPDCKHKCVHYTEEIVNTSVTQHRASGTNTHKHFWNSVFDVLSQLLHGPPKINISFLSPMADLEEASVKQLILSGNEIYFSRQNNKHQVFVQPTVLFSLIFTFKSSWRTSSLESNLQRSAPWTWSQFAGFAAAADGLVQRLNLCHGLVLLTAAPLTSPSQLSPPHAKSQGFNPACEDFHQEVIFSSGLRLFHLSDDDDGCSVWS